MLCRMLIVDTLREGVHLPYTEVKSQRRAGPDAAPPNEAAMIWVRSVDCEEVRAKLCIHSPRE